MTRGGTPDGGRRGRRNAPQLRSLRGVPVLVTSRRTGPEGPGPSFLPRAGYGALYPGNGYGVPSV